VFLEIRNEEKMKKQTKTYLFGLVILAFLLAGCASQTPGGTGVTSEPQWTSTPDISIPDVQLKLIRTIDGGANSLSLPIDLAIDSHGHLYILASRTNQIQVFDPSGKFLQMWGKTGTGNGEFNFYNQNPEMDAGAVAIDANDNIYVLDTLNYRVQKFMADGTYISQWGVKGRGDGQFLFPIGIAVDMQGNVTVTDEETGVIQKFDSNGKFLSKLNQQDFGGGHLGPLAIGADGTMYVADNYRTRFIIFKDGIYTGEVNVEQESWNMRVDSKGNIFVVSEGLVVKYDSSGKHVYRFTGLKTPGAVAVDANGLIYISDIDTNTVKVFQEP
jgi:tripartite motif-containing protein 71